MDQEVTYERPRRRGSAFTEIGLEGHDEILDKKLDTLARPKLQVRFRSNISVVEPEAVTSEPPTPLDVQDLVKPTSRVAPWLQIVVLVMALLLVAPSINVHPLLSSISFVPPMAQASPVRPRNEGLDTIAAPQIKRTDSQTDVCKRWSGQSAVVNGTLYYYGGRSTSSAEQTSDTWNNNFVSIDLSQDWQISSPIIKGLPIPSGPPAVSLGSLWASTDNLYLYGGEFSDNPVDDPTAFALWSYDISSGNWNEHDNPTFANGDTVQRAAEGAGISVPGLGRGYYFGGHLDYLTTQGWSEQVARVYLPTLLEFTMPGFSNAALDSKSPTGSDGAYRNISTDNAGFPERADGILVYIPGYSNEGIILGLAGGTNATFTQMNVIDVYDIASSTWYKQATSGSTPEIRVNPCAVAATAADGSSTQVYMYGGQNLIPAGEQTQYDDVWILTLPSFTWIKVNTDGQSVPPARAGHTCNIWNGQMVVIGGYVGQDLSCDSPGIYVFNTSSLSWQNNYVALSGADPLNRQESQKDDTNALQGSYGYEVPSAVQSIVGGNAVGGATITGPAQTATSGPLATGKPHTYTVTNPDGSTATATSVPGSGTDATSKNGGGGGGGSSTNVGAIVAGVIAGLLFLLVIYLVYCAYVYRKQLKVYKNHTAMAQRSRLAGSTSDPPFMVFRQNGKASTKGEQSGSSHGEKSNGDRFSSDNRSGNSNNASANSARRQEWPSNNPYNNVPGGQGYATAASSTEDLMSGMEPTFLGVLLNPRRSLRVVNRD